MKNNKVELTDSLVGILKGDYDDKEIRTERMSRYEKKEPRGVCNILRGHTF